jgi:mono/diheme cytochrome c family protein
VAIDLAHSTAVNAPDPRNAIRVVLAGITPSPGEPGPMMPAFVGALTDQQIADLMNYIRSHFGHGPAWGTSVDQVRAIRTGQEKS